MSVIFNSPNVVVGHMSGGTININHNYSTQPAKQQQRVCEDVEPIPQEQQASNIPHDFFCVSTKFTEQDIRSRLDAELAQATSKIDYCRALYRLQHMGCINISQYASDAQRAIVFNNFQSKYNLVADDFRKARINK